MKNLRVIIPMLVTVAGLIGLAATPIRDLRLQSDMDGGGNSITNVDAVVANSFTGDGSGLTNLTGVGGSYLSTATGGIVSNDVRLIAGSDFTVGPVLADPPTHAALLFIATGGQASAFATDINNDLFGSQWGGAANDPYANLVLAGEDSGIWLIGKHEGSHANSLTLVTLNPTNGWDYGFALGMDTTNATSVGDFYILGGTDQDDLLTSSMFAPFRIDRQTEAVVLGGYTQRLGAQIWGLATLDQVRIRNNGFNSAWAYGTPTGYGSSGNTHLLVEGDNTLVSLMGQPGGNQGVILQLGEVGTDGELDNQWYLSKYTANSIVPSSMGIGYATTTNTQSDASSTNLYMIFQTDGYVGFPRTTGIFINGPIYRRGDANTYVSFPAADTAVVQAGGTSVVTVTPGGVVVDGTHAADSYSGDGSALTAVDAATGDSATGFFDAGTIELARGGTGQSLTDPNADGIFLWDDSDTGSEINFAAIGSGLSFDGNTLSATASGNYVPDSGGNATNLTLAGTTTLNGTLVATNATLSVSNLQAQTGFFSGALSATGNVNVAEYLLHDGDSNTGFRFQPDQITGYAGNFQWLEVTTTATVFNIDGTTRDAIIEGDTDPALVFVDAGNDRVGIGDSTPGYKLEVNGSAYATAHVQDHTPYVLSTNRTWTVAELQKGVPIYVTGASTQTWPTADATLPDVPVIADAAVVVTIRPDASDQIRTLGTTDTAGDGIVSGGSVGDMAIISYGGGSLLRATHDGNWTAE